MLKKIENALENMIFLFSVSILFARINIQMLLNQDAFIVQGKLCKILSVLWKKIMHQPYFQCISKLFSINVQYLCFIRHYW